MNCEQTDRTSSAPFQRFRPYSAGGRRAGEISHTTLARISHTTAAPKATTEGPLSMYPLSLARPFTPAVAIPAVAGATTGQILRNGFTWKRAPVPAPGIVSQLVVGGRS